MPDTQKAPAPAAPKGDERRRLCGAAGQLAGPTAKRYEIYGEHADGDMPAAGWHAETLRAAGFAEARPVWASPSDTLLLALK